MEQNRLISHNSSIESNRHYVQLISDRIKKEGDKPYASISFQLDILLQLSAFDFGAYLLENQGINGFWTHYMLTHPWFGKKTGKNNSGDNFSPLEDFILNQSPLMLATQQRFEIFLEENQKQVRKNAKLASIPSGLLGELLYLNYQGIDAIELVGIDYDPETLTHAQQLAQQQNLANYVTLLQKDAWDLNIENQFDLISSNGLNIYEPDDSKVIDLYRQFYRALKPKGKLVSSFLTYPPTLTTDCEWDFTNINQEDLLLQKIIFADIINSKWQCYRSSSQTKEQLQSAGFENIEFIYDKAKIFPTVVAIK